MKQIYFDCQKHCATYCCGGATLLTHKEIAHLRYFFPISVGFRKYPPANEEHFKLLNDFGTYHADTFIIGEFIAGSWQEGRCKALMPNNHCSLHTLSHKPLQCSLVPFSSIYPEAMQDAVMQTQRQGCFKHCQGFDTQTLLWENGKFTCSAIKEQFYQYQDALRHQKPFMLKVLTFLRGSEAYKKFLHPSNSGILHIDIPQGLPQGLVDDFVKLCGL